MPRLGSAKEKMPVGFESNIRILFLRVFQAMKKRPNKAPEPTRTAVTPRAMELKAEKKKSVCESNEARVAPAVRVAHL
jgi:hypothetical protein